MMKRLWAEALDLVRQGGATHVLLKYTDANGAAVEVPTSIANLNDDSLDTGVLLDNGDVVFPNPTTAVLNPFLMRHPIISFVCDLRRHAAGGQIAPPIRTLKQEDLDVAGSELMSLFPDRDETIVLPGVIIPMPGDNNVEIAPSVITSRSPPSISVPSTAPASSASTPKARRISSDPGTSSEHRGTSCHQCKNARSLDQLAYCSKLFSKRTSHDMRHCRKKFCHGCLTKFYGDSIENSKITGWVCPSCRGSCRCAACERKRRKSAVEATTPTPNNMFGSDVIDDIMSGPGGSPSMPDEHIEQEGILDISGAGKVLMRRRASEMRLQPYPTDKDVAEPLGLDVDQPTC